MLAETQVRKQHRPCQAQTKEFLLRAPGTWIFLMEEYISLWQCDNMTVINIHIYLAKYPH